MSVQEKLPGVQICAAQMPAEHVCDELHAVVVEASPSGLHNCRLLPTQVALPGVHTHAPQSCVVGLQLVPPPHAVVAPYRRPSALQLRVPVDPTQPGVPGEHSHPTHAPPLHDCPALHGLALQLRPSAAQVSTVLVLPLAQRSAPAVQMRVRHTPTLQLSDDPHGNVALVCPSALHTERAANEAHVAVPGAHVHAAHIPSPRQAFIAGHAAVP